jgi:hypothetical protein
MTLIKKKNHSTSSGYYDGRDNRRVIKRKNHRKNKRGRRRRICESLSGRGEKIKERRSNNLYKQHDDEKRDKDHRELNE